MFSEEKFDKLTQKFNLLSYDGTEDELREVNQELFLFKNGLNAKFDKIFEKVLSTNQDIDDVSNDVQILRAKVNSLEHKDAGSIQNYKDIEGIYKKHLIVNWKLFTFTLFMVLAGGGGVYMTTFK